MGLHIIYDHPGLRSRAVRLARAEFKKCAAATSAKWRCARSRGPRTNFWAASPVQLGVFLSVAQSWVCWPARLPPRWTLQRNIKLWRGPRESDAVTQWMAPDLHEHLASKSSPFNMQYNRERIVNPLLSCWAQWFVCKPFIWQPC